MVIRLGVLYRVAVAVSLFASTTARVRELMDIQGWSVGLEGKKRSYKNFSSGVDQLKNSCSTRLPDRSALCSFRPARATHLSTDGQHDLLDTTVSQACPTLGDQTLALL